MNPPIATGSPALRASHLGAGSRAMVTAIEGGEGVVERFASLGLMPGTRFKVMRGGSPMAVAVGETRLALGPDWANALVVVSQ
jgi:Fe2+ transport system protein FeoA